MSASEPQLVVRLDSIVLAAMREELNAVSEQVVAVVIAEVPSYRDAFSGSMGETIRDAVALALDGFLELSSREADADAGTPLEPVVEGAYRLGRGEARSGRSMEALLAAYRVGARVAWRGLSGRAVEAGLPADQVAHFAELVFAYIDELSAASAAGHADELETSGRVRQRLLERLARQLVGGAAPDSLVAAAKRAEWEVPETLTAVLLPPGQLRGASASLTSRTLVAGEDLPDLDTAPYTASDNTASGNTSSDSADLALLLVPDAHRATLLRGLEGRHAVVGPTVPWLRSRSSYLRAVRTRALKVRPATGAPVDSDRYLARLVLAADAEALVDLRARVLLPLAALRPATEEKLTETLRAWLLCRGRREQVAELLHVHPQTVRYRVTQLRELFGADLDDPGTVLELTMALGPLDR
ncbi:MAG: PucR family transcriptional regulator [Marmoricola sp.]